MLRSKELVWCPVGKHIELGYRTAGTAAIFVCRECRYIFPVDAKGKFGVPVKITPTKLPVTRQYCGPDGCVCRD
jgi:uncharacterized protein YbaR (Trm112 family)